MNAPAHALPSLDPAVLAAFRRRVPPGAPIACWPGPRKILVAGVFYQCRPLAWYAAHGVWPSHPLRLTCFTPDCLNEVHMSLIRQREVTAWTKQSLPPDEVARFLGIDTGTLGHLCRTVLGRKAIGARDLDVLAEALAAQGRLFAGVG